MRPESGVSVVKTSQLLWGGGTSTSMEHAVRHEPNRLLLGLKSLLRHRDEAHVVLGVASCF